MTRPVAYMRGKNALAAKVNALGHRVGQCQGPTPVPPVYRGGAALGGWHCWSSSCALLGKEEDKQKPFHGGEHPSGARTRAIQCLINCADLKRIDKLTQLFVNANKSSFFTGRAVVHDLHSQSSCGYGWWGGGVLAVWKHIPVFALSP